MSHTNRSTSFFRNFIFGVEDSLVSTVGLLSGVALATVPAKTIFLIGVVLIFVEAFSMSAGAFLSETSAEGYAHKRETPTTSPAIAAAIMFVSYFISGFIPLFPYVVFPVGEALPISIGLSVLTLFCLGIFSASLSRTSLLRSGLRMVVVGGLAIAVGITAGILVGI